MKKTGKLALILIAAALLTACGEKSSTHDWALLDAGDEYVVVYDGKVLDYRLEQEESDWLKYTSSRLKDEPFVESPNGERIFVVYRDKFTVCDKKGAQTYEGWLEDCSDDGKSFIQYTRSNEPRDGETLIDHHDVYNLVTNGVSTEIDGIENISLSPGGDLITWTNAPENSQKLYIAHTSDLKPFVTLDFDGSVAAMPDDGRYALLIDRDRMLSRLDLKTGETTELDIVNGGFINSIYKNAAETELLFSTENETCFVKDGVLRRLDSEKVPANSLYPIGYNRERLNRSAPETFIGNLFVLSRGFTCDLVRLVESDGGYDVETLAERIALSFFAENFDGWFYYSVKANDREDLYRVSAKGAPEKLASDISYCYPSENGVYFQYKNGSFKYRPFKTDSKTDSTLISNADVIVSGVLGDTIFFKEENEPGKIFSSKNGGAKKIAHSSADFSCSVRVYDTFVVVTEHRDQPEYFVSTDGRKFEQVFY